MKQCRRKIHSSNGAAASEWTPPMLPSPATHFWRWTEEEKQAHKEHGFRPVLRNRSASNNAWKRTHGNSNSIAWPQHSQRRRSRPRGKRSDKSERVPIGRSLPFSPIAMSWSISVSRFPGFPGHFAILPGAWEPFLHRFSSAGIKPQFNSSTRHKSAFLCPGRDF